MKLTELGDERILRRYEYEDGWVIAADLDVDDEAVTVDTVGETAIVVIESDEDDVETDFELPGEATTVTVHNGVLTIEGDR